ncbi:MAG: hypothetical protein ABIA12_02965 [Candidatus Aenigmatarchaeota archaeon]
MDIFLPCFTYLLFRGQGKKDLKLRTEYKTNRFRAPCAGRHHNQKNGGTYNATEQDAEREGSAGQARAAAASTEAAAKTAGPAEAGRSSATAKLQTTEPAKASDAAKPAESTQAANTASTEAAATAYAVEAATSDEG